ncbi:DEAD/DEAH box helicase [Gluconacetobacter aggeris]|uniref:DEAD-box ATP-dependent RNA helicase RhpA n=1 Tax=Gluconacetobacter aggeris TaxID=1286186 RepID=A0A7W4ITJ2_9PROT|nr:DEAD/DEAH box helicase [Gluconacetobacter aggeris]MBB2168754.1 DEAD/DEAH box helicase [Gluconacetobacter aggeris]
MSPKTNASASAEHDAEVHPVSIVPPDTDAGSPGEEPSAFDAVDLPAGQADAAPQPLFSDLGLSEPIQRAIDEAGYRHPTPIQAQAIPYVLMGRDVLGVAQTGTGKTASFTLPMLEILSGSRARARMPRSLILEPTRELALQVAENFVKYGKYLKLNHALLIGGESMAEQKDVLNRGVDVLIATPGRLIDLFERGGLLLTQTRLLVIDEADRMLDMGFIPDIEKIVGMLSPLRQTLFFSATMAPEIRRLADMFLQNPKEITVSRPSSVATTIEAGLVVVDEDDKRRVLRQMLRDDAVQNAIVFCNRKRDVDVLCKSLVKHGFSAGALHGDLPQSVRFSTLERFKAGDLRILVCSDVAARGIDIGGLSHVFNFDLPFHAEDYVHRIGRTGRAGRTGHAYSLASPHDRGLAEAIETLVGHPIPRLAVEGVTQLEWSEEERPRGGKGRGRGREKDDRRGGKPARPAAPAAATPVEPPPAREATAAPPPPARKPPPHRHPREREQEDTALANGNAVLGFGAEIPAFMLLPRRQFTITPSADDESTHTADELA